MIPLFLLLPPFGFVQQAPASQTTLFVNCQENERPKSVFSPVSLSEGGKWRAYVEVQSDLECLLTTRLWVARANASYRLVYLMPPKRTAGGNGMEILGWARNSRMLLVKTAEWQWGSDAGDTQQVLAIDAGTGVVYEPELQAILEARKDQNCLLRIGDAGFSDDKNVNILIRAKLSTAHEVDETENDVPPAMRCGNAEETWSFNFASGEIKQVANTLPLQLFKNSLPNRPEPRR
ncbi:MAG TPA: hypothetical protein VFO27_09125 [Bryobacteraceae bacterium]|nr:hypothetical protein [Bryobacteraceae bacterium]